MIKKRLQRRGSLSAFLISKRSEYNLATNTNDHGWYVAGVPVEDILTIVNLKRGWQYVTPKTENLTLPMEKQVNKIMIDGGAGLINV